MTPKQKAHASKQFLERVVPISLRKEMGLHDLKAITVFPYNGPEGWTWDIDWNYLRAEFGEIATLNAEHVVRELQGAYDLVDPLGVGQNSPCTHLRSWR